MRSLMEDEPAGMCAIAGAVNGTITAWRRWESASLRGWRVELDAEVCPPAAQWPYDREHRLLVVDVVDRGPRAFSLAIMDCRA